MLQQPTGFPQTFPFYESHGCNTVGVQKKITERSLANTRHFRKVAELNSFFHVLRNEGERFLEPPVIIRSLTLHGLINETTPGCQVA